MQIFWGLGALLEVCLALVVMPTLGWRYLLGLSAVPLLFLLAIICFWLPESSRYHVACGEMERATAMLQQVANENGKPMLKGKLRASVKEVGFTP